jgi:hypothetical protein
MPATCLAFTHPITFSSPVSPPNSHLPDLFFDRTHPTQQTSTLTQTQTRNLPLEGGWHPLIHIAAAVQTLPTLDMQ